MEELSKLTPEELASAVKRLYEQNGPLCDSEGFYNHMGECWNDALQMIFLNSDFIKEKVQGKLATDNVDPAEVDEIFRPYVEESIDLLLQSKRQLLNDYKKNQMVLGYIGNIYAYLETVQKRFHRHYYAEALRLSLKDELCTLEDRKGLQSLTKLKAISLLQRAKGKEGTMGAFLGQNIERYQHENLRVAKAVQNLYVPGGGQEDRDNVYVMFQQFFDLPISQTYFRHKAVSIQGTKQSQSLFLDGKNDMFILNDDCIALYAGFFSLLARETGHAVCFYTCGGRDYYFNDNVGTIQFPWKIFFKHLSDKKTSEMLAGESIYLEEPIHALNKITEWKIYFDGKLSIQDSSGYSLFSTRSYPYLMRTMYEKVTKPEKITIPYEVLTYLWDGTPIKLGSRISKFADFTYEKKISTESGEQITVNFELGQPTNILKFLTRFQKLPGAVTNTRTASSLKKNELTGAFLGTRVQNTNTKVIDAILQEFLEKVKKRSANINDLFYTDPHGDTYTALTLAIENEKLDLIEEILGMGADVSKRMSDGSSPLFLATSFGLPLNIVAKLLEKGAAINDRDNRPGGYTPLIGAILLNDEPSLEVIEFLLENGATIDLSSKRTDTTPIEYAVLEFKEEVVRLLETYGAKVPTCPSKENLLKLVDRDMFDTQLMSYIRNHKLIKARLLTRCYRELELFDAINYENKVGDTALKLAIRHEPDDKLLQDLIRNGADVNHIDAMGFTPIHYAIKIGSVDAIEELVQNDINYQLSAPSAGTPMEYAERLGNQEIIKLLKDDLKKYTARLERKKKLFTPIPTVPVKKTPMSFTPRPVKKLTLGKALDNTRRGGRRFLRHKKRKTHKRKH
jgi:ankyrin repeat protein